MVLNTAVSEYTNKICLKLTSIIELPFWPGKRKGNIVQYSYTNGVLCCIVYECGQSPEMEWKLPPASHYSLRFLLKMRLIIPLFLVFVSSVSGISLAEEANLITQGKAHYEKVRRRLCSQCLKICVNSGLFGQIPQVRVDGDPSMLHTIAQLVVSKFISS